MFILFYNIAIYYYNTVVCVYFFVCVRVCLRVKVCVCVYVCVSFILFVYKTWLSSLFCLFCCSVLVYMFCSCPICFDKYSVFSFPLSSVCSLSHSQSHSQRFLFWHTLFIYLVVVVVSVVLPHNKHTSSLLVVIVVVVKVFKTVQLFSDIHEFVFFILFGRWSFLGVCLWMCECVLVLGVVVDFCLQMFCAQKSQIFIMSGSVL